MKNSVVLLILVTFALPAPLQAQDDKPTPFNFNFYMENDTAKMGGPGSDDNYTNGVRISFLYGLNKSPRWTRLFPWLRNYIKDSSFNYGMGLGQQLYTPRELSRNPPDREDRPYAAWLYVSPSLNIIKDHRLDRFELDIGVVGPYALGAETQTAVHKAIGAELPQGWEHEIHTEMGVVLSFESKYDLWDLYTAQGNRYFDFLPYYGWSVGNVYDAVDVGGLMRLGLFIPNDFGPVRPSAGNGDGAFPGRESASDNHWSANVFAGAKGSFVAHSIFLDGNTFQSSAKVRRVPVVTEYEGGFTLSAWDFSLTWRVVSRSPEFYEKYSPHSFASLGVTYGARF